MVTRIYSRLIRLKKKNCFKVQNRSTKCLFIYMNIIYINVYFCSVIFFFFCFFFWFSGGLFFVFLCTRVEGREIIVSILMILIRRFQTKHVHVSVIIRIFNCNSTDYDRIIPVPALRSSFYGLFFSTRENVVFAVGFLVKWNLCVVGDLKPRPLRVISVKHARRIF